MGRGMVTQMVLMNGMMPAIVSDIKVENAVNAFKYAGVKEDDIAIAKTLADANAAMEAGQYVACEDANFVSQANLVECAIDATGVPDVGAKVATDAVSYTHLVKKGELLTYDDVELDKSTLIYQLRKEQDAMYGRNVL